MIQQPHMWSVLNQQNNTGQMIQKIRLLIKKKHPIPVFILVYQELNIIKKCIESIIGDERLEIYVIENKSKNSKEIRKYLLCQLRKGNIKACYFFRDNISNNAYDIILDQKKHIYRKSKYLIISDGDLKVDSKGWLDEEISILKDNKVFACGVSLDMSNLPIKSFPESIDWIPPVIKETNKYYISNTGIHLLMIRTNKFIEAQNILKSKRLKFLDSNFHSIAESKNMYWTRTKMSTAKHLTWDLYKNKKHNYTRHKIKNQESIWNHDRVSKYDEYYN